MFFKKHRQQKSPWNKPGAFLFYKKMDYIFLVVSFLVVSALVVSILAVVSIFAAVSILAESIAAESAAEPVDLPLQATAETEIAKAKTASLNEFFIFVFFKVINSFQGLIPQTKKGNPHF
jgi:hypothetical protein